MDVYPSTLNVVARLELLQDIQIHTQSTAYLRIGWSMCTLLNCVLSIVLVSYGSNDIYGTEFHCTQPFIITQP